MKKRNKNNLPIFDSDQDFLAAFEEKKEKRHDQDKNGLYEDTVSQNPGSDKNFIDPIVEKDFAELLEDSFKAKRVTPLKKSAPMPLKRRLKRYPPAEIFLDLHGYTAIGAQVKARSFIHECKRQGFFTLKIIVGKGRHSDFGPVLPDVVEDVVREMKKQELVLWFEWEKKTKTNSGALIVYLKQFEQFEG